MQDKQLTCYLALGHYTNLVRPYFVTLVYAPEFPSDLAQALVPYNFDLLNQAKLRKLKSLLKVIQPYSDYFWLHTMPVGYELEIYQELAIAKTINFLYLLCSISNQLYHGKLCWVRGTYFNLKLNKPFLYQSLRDQPELSLLTKVALIIARYHRLQSIYHLARVFPQLNLDVHLGKATPDHLARLSKLNYLPPCYLTEKTVYAWLKKYQSSNNPPSWIQKQLLQNIKPTLLS